MEIATKIRTLKKLFIVLTERLPFGKALLGFYATAYARCCGLDASAYFDGMVWLHRVDGRIFADGFSYPYDRMAIRKWCNQYQTVEEKCRDTWFHRYTPCVGDFVVDVGAGTGEETFIFSKIVGERGKVLSVEAHPKTFILLERMCYHNRLGNVVLENKALMDKPGSVYIEDTDHWIGNSIVHYDDYSRRILPINAETLDQLLLAHHMPHIDFVKMNIEGAEKYALYGMENTLKEVKAVAIAAHDFRAKSDDSAYRTKEGVKNLLEASGFKTSMRLDDPRPWIRDIVYGVR